VTGGFSAISNVIGGIGKALESVAGKRNGGTSIVIFGVELPLPPPPPK